MRVIKSSRSPPARSAGNGLPASYKQQPHVYAQQTAIKYNFQYSTPHASHFWNCYPCNMLYSNFREKPPPQLFHCCRIVRHHARAFNSALKVGKSVNHVIWKCCSSVATILADAAVTPTVSEMTYNVSSGMLNHTQPTSHQTCLLIC